MSFYLNSKEIIDKAFEIYNTPKQISDFIYTYDLPPTDFRLRFFYYLNNKDNLWYVIDVKHKETWMGEFIDGVFHYVVGSAKYDYQATEAELINVASAIEKGFKWQISREFLNHLKRYVGHDYSKQDFNKFKSQFEYICGGHITL